MKKCFFITEFGSPFSWTNEYIKNVSNLAQYGWKWRIFTPNKYDNLPSNVEIIDMTTEQYSDLVEKKLGIKPDLYITDKGIPSVHITDFYIFSGVVFEDYIKDCDFWGITNMDVVYGRLSNFIPDKLLEKCDIFSDDIYTINGIFSLFRNNEKINSLFKEIPHWKEILSQPVCPKCNGTGENHTLFGSDEYDMTKVIRNKKDIIFMYPNYYPLHSHDRLEQHVPKVKLRMIEDSLWELFEDTKPPHWEHARPMMGREIAYFHFQRTKLWPIK